ncbi:MAG: CoA-binding protein [Thermodesulfobacteriota bacterium]
MLKNLEDSPLYRLACPRSLAFFGASNNVTSMGTNLLLSLLAMGYEGAIYPVHPQEDEVQGLKAYRSVTDLPEVPDAAVLVLPTGIVSRTIAECGRQGITRAIVVSGGFKEVGGEGVALEKELEETATRYGVRVLGPNGLGVANPHHKVNTTFIPFEGEPGYIGLASQSGSFVTQMFNYLAGQGLGFSTALSVGNEMNLDLVDCLEYLGACPRTKVIALYIEGLKRGRAFVEAARSIAPHKPIVAFYIGGSETGRKAGFSHTGALAGPDRLYDGIFRQAGVIRARSVTEMFDFCRALAELPRPGGRRVVIQTHSGGPGAAAADACGRAGLDLPALSPATREKLRPLVTHTSSLNNPVDLTFSKNFQDFYSAIPRALLEDENTDMLLVYFLTPEAIIHRTLNQMGLPEDKVEEEGRQLMDGFIREVAELKKLGKPIAGYTWRPLDEYFLRRLGQRGLPVFPGAERAARALAALVLYHKLREKIIA